MSIQPIGTIDTPTPADAIYQAQAVSSTTPSVPVTAAQEAAQDLNGVSYLTAGDRDFLTYLYGSDFVQNLTTGVLPLQSPQTVQNAQYVQNAEDLQNVQDRQDAQNVQAAQLEAQRLRDLQSTQALQADQAAVRNLLAPTAQPGATAPSTATQIATAAQNPVAVPQFVLDLIDDRRSGVLPVGTEITSSYVQNQYDAYLAATGTSGVQAPLTQDDVQAAQDYFDRRVTGAAVDVQV
jgi:hypothetical protein